MAGTVKVAYIDDSPNELRRFTGRLGRTGALTVIPFSPPARMDLDRIVSGRPDLLLVDYALVRPGPTSGESYLGGALAAKFRELYQDFPIVMFTRKSLIRDDRQYGGAWDVLGQFDAFVDKTDVERDPGAASFHLRSLALGYRVLRAKRKRDWGALVRALAARSEEEPVLSAAAPPLGRSGSRFWRVAEAARWVNSVVLRFPGIVYDAVHAATALGIDVRAFARDDVQATFEPAQYTGVFAPPEKRWWRGRLFESAYAVMKEAGIDKPIPTGFAEAYRENHSGGPLRPAECIWSKGKEGPADWVCCVLEQPVMRKYTLAYNLDDRPAVMDPARVSFTVIRDRDDVELELLTPEGRKIAGELLEGSTRCA